jgi:hypothetical protein
MSARHQKSAAAVYAAFGKPAEDAVPEPLFGQLGKEPFDGIELARKIR